MSFSLPFFSPFFSSLLAPCFIICWLAYLLPPCWRATGALCGVFRPAGCRRLAAGTARGTGRRWTVLHNSHSKSLSGGGGRRGAKQKQASQPSPRAPRGVAAYSQKGSLQKQGRGRSQKEAGGRENKRRSGAPPDTLRPIMMLVIGKLIHAITLELHPINK